MGAGAVNPQKIDTTDSSYTVSKLDVIKILGATVLEFGQKEFIRPISVITAHNASV